MAANSGDSYAYAYPKYEVRPLLGSQARCLGPRPLPHGCLAYDYIMGLPM